MKTTMKANASRATKTAGESIRAAADQVGVLRNSMTFLVPLTEAERTEHRNARIGVRRLRLIATRLEAARQYREHLPEAFDYRSFERDARATASLADLLTEVDTLRTAVHDTLLVTANRGAVAAQSVYGYIQVGSVTAERLKRTVTAAAAHGPRKADGNRAATEKPSTETPAAKPAAAAAAPAASPTTPPGTAPPPKVEPPSANPPGPEPAPKGEVA
jgi:hypothetical protein